MIDKINFKKIYLEILKIRILEETISKKYKNQEMRCPIHLSIGQEAVAVGICQNLKDKDQIVSNHRCHAHYLAKGGSMKKMINELYGNSFGCSGGRGGSMHLFDQKKGILSSVPIVSSSIPVGVGAGFYLKYSKKIILQLFFLVMQQLKKVFFMKASIMQKFSLCLFCLCVKIIYFHASQI